jgi:predicted NUDIX family NTP pyrophosphohydrolase
MPLVVVRFTTKARGGHDVVQTKELRMPQTSAGILLYRKRPAGIQVMLVHPGGPFWARKDEGAWSIPKGLAEDGEDLLAAAKREFFEETGKRVDGEFLDLGAYKQPAGKMVVAWGCEGDLDPAVLKSNSFSIEWPPHSGKETEFPEVDRAGWFDLDEALAKVTKGQRPIIAALAETLGAK